MRGLNTVSDRGMDSRRSINRCNTEYHNMTLTCTTCYNNMLRLAGGKMNDFHIVIYHCYKKNFSLHWEKKYRTDLIQIHRRLFSETFGCSMVKPGTICKLPPNEGFHLD